MARIDANKKIHLLELSQLYQKRYGGTRQSAHDAIKQTFDTIKAELIAGNSVTIPHFARFYGKEIPARLTHVPSRPSKFTVVPKHTLYHMSPSRAFHDDTPHAPRGGWKYHDASTKKSAAKNNK